MATSGDFHMAIDRRAGGGLAKHVRCASRTAERQMATFFFFNVRQRRTLAGSPTRI